MARATSRFRIRRPFGPPAARNFSRSIITNKEWQNVRTSLNVQRVDIDPSETEPRTHAVMPSWRYGTSDSLAQLETWVNLPQADEEDAIASAVDILQAELDELEAKSTPTADDTKRIAELERDIAGLYSDRYWTQAYNTFGDGRAALYRACSAPNVPYRLRSSWRLQPDRPLTFFVHRSKPHEAQKDCYVRLRFGRWALILSQEREIQLVRYKDGQVYEVDEEQADKNPLAGGTWKTYSGTDFDATDTKEQAIAQLRDNGRLTSSDRAQIATWQQQIRDLKAELKQNKKTWEATGRQDQIDNVGAQLADLKRSIEELRDSKRGLTAAEELQVKRLEEELYAERTSVNFSRAAESLFNVDLAITIIPQPRGFMVLHNSIGRDYFVCEDGDVTSSGLDGNMIGATPVQVDGNGGALWFSLAYVIPEPYSLLESERQSFGGKGLAGGGELHWDATLTPGTTIVGQVIPVGDDHYRWKLEMTCDPDAGYLPFLYRLYFDYLALPRRVQLEEVVFDSAAHPELAWNYGFSRERENRGRTASLMLNLEAEQVERYGWLETLQGHQLEIEENGEITFTGELGDAEVEWVGRHRKIAYRSYDRWAILVGDRLWSDLIGDARTLANYVRLIARGAGLTDAEIIIADNAVTRRQLPHSLPGDDPALVPEWGSSRGDYLAQLVADFGYWHDLYFDGRGRLRLEPLGSTSSPVHLRTSHRSASDRDAVWNVRETISKASLRNYVVVLGRKLKGRQLASVYLDEPSVEDRTSERHLGRLVADEPYHNEALNTQALCDLTCSWRAWLGRQLDRTLSASGHYRQDLASGDRFRFDDHVVELISLGADDRTAEEVTLTMKVIR